MGKRQCRNIRYMFWGFCAALVLVICMKLDTVRTEADTAYTKIWADYDTRVVKNGKYYLKIDE